MLLARKRTHSLDSLDSEQRMSKCVRRQWSPQFSPSLAPTKVEFLNTLQSPILSAPPSTATSNSSSSSSPPSPLQCSNQQEPSLSASHSSPSCSISPSSPASLSSSVTPPSSPSKNNAISVLSPPIGSQAPLSSEDIRPDDVFPNKEARLTARYQDDFRRIWSGSMLIFQTTTGIYDLLVRLGLWTGTRAERLQLGRDFPDMKDVFSRTRATGNLHEISTHPAFYNPLHSIVDDIMQRCDDIFREIRDGVLPSTAIARLVEIHPQAIDNLKDLDSPTQRSSMKLVDELFCKQRPYITASSARKTCLLYQGLSQYWGFYFSFSATSLDNESSLPPPSSDLAFAVKLLNSYTPSTTRSAAKSPSEVARVFYALYLARILVLRHFLDSLPPDLSESQAHKEWLYFQLAPPRAPSGIDIFTAVLEAISGGELNDLRRCADCTLTGLGWRNHKWFSKSFSTIYRKEGAYVEVREDGIPPLYIVVDEIETPVCRSLKPRAARRAARRRAQVYSLLCQPHSS